MDRATPPPFPDRQSSAERPGAEAQPRVRVVPLAPRQVRELRTWLGDAFADDPMLQYALQADPKRRSRAAWLLSCVTRYGARFAVADTTPGLHGTAVWLPPDHPQMTWWGTGLAGMWLTPFKVGWSGWHRLARYNVCRAALRERAIDEPHWYLLVTAVDPRRQGSGLGRALLEFGIERARRDGLPCYLETTCEKNVAYFQRYGFREVCCAEVAGGDLTIWSMLRPRGGGS